MKLSKILIYILFLGLVGSQLSLIFMKVGLSDPYDYGYFVGKIIVVVITFIIFRIVLKFINK